MKIIATTEKGVIIEATDQEIKAVLSAVGINDKPSIGQKIPAFDYGSLISRAKSLRNNSYLNELEIRLKYFNTAFNELKEAIGLPDHIEE